MFDPKRIKNAKLAFEDREFSSNLYTISFSESEGITEIRLQSGLDSEIEPLDHDAEGGLLIPSMCHSHIHLDKCYILERSCLQIGDFQEALKVTSEIKKSFLGNEAGLYTRGDKLIHESVGAGVTAMRAHVEVDDIVQFSCLNAGIRLKRSRANICDVQLCAFMQEPMVKDLEDKSENARLLEEALYKNKGDISAIGSAPYVEHTRAQQIANINIILDLAMVYNLHVDFHLDYDLSSITEDCDTGPLIYPLIEELHRRNWSATNRTVAIGHATRLSLFSSSRLKDLRERIGSLPIHFIGLPQSDLYMMGRNFTGSIPRGTLNVNILKKDYHFHTSIAVNNVGNAFTPQGIPDPLTLCPLGVAIYQDCTYEGCHNLLNAITTDAKLAIGLNDITVKSSIKDPLVPKIGQSADFVILPENPTLQSALTSPSFERYVVKGGRLTSWRKMDYWIEF